MGWRLLGTCLAVVVLSVAAYILHSIAPIGAGRPNVVIYLVDTLRADHLGVFGYHRDTSPALDRWASETVVFDRAYSPTSWTKSACVSLLSGLDPFNHRVEDRFDVIPTEVRLLSEHLKGRGYGTFAVVTNPNVLPLWGFDRGFDVYYDLDASGRRTRADAVLNYVTDQIPRYAEHRPFLLYMHLLDPHQPYDPPAPFDTKYSGEADTREDAKAAAYDGEIAFGDSQFRRLLDSLRAHDLYDDTLIVFVADHGEEFRDHGRTGHGHSLYQELIRVPLLIKFPRNAHAGSRVQAPVSLIDVVPTVMSALGEPPVQGLDGRDLTQLLADDTPRWAGRDLFLSLDLAATSNHTDVIRGILSGSQKYLRRVRPNRAEMLFDIAADPGEVTNQAAVRAESRSLLAARLDRYIATKSTGIHLRILNGFAARPVQCGAVLQTTGRFVEVSAYRLEAGDHFEISDDGRTLRLDCRLENRPLPGGAGGSTLADEDGLIFLVSPAESAIVVGELSLAGDRSIPLRVGPDRLPRAVPFRFDPTRREWMVRDIEETLRRGGASPSPGRKAAYLAVVPPPIEREDVPSEVHDRLRALGYLTEASESE